MFSKKLESRSDSIRVVFLSLYSWQEKISDRFVSTEDKPSRIHGFVSPVRERTLAGLTPWLGAIFPVVKCARVAVLQSKGESLWYVTDIKAASTRTCRIPAVSNSAHLVFGTYRAIILRNKVNMPACHASPSIALPKSRRSRLVLRSSEHKNFHRNGKGKLAESKM